MTIKTRVEESAGSADGVRVPCPADDCDAVVSRGEVLSIGGADVFDMYALEFGGGEIGMSSSAMLAL
jgi:hypothetical protein